LSTINTTYLDTVYTSIQFAFNLSNETTHDQTNVSTFFTTFKLSFIPAVYKTIPTTNLKTFSTAIVSSNSTTIDESNQLSK
jgi:hypothetical protein